MQKTINGKSYKIGPHAYLSYADLSYADLRGANLRGTNLSYADLRGTNLRGTNLYGTILSPTNAPNAIVDAFAHIDGWVIGYRTAHSPVIGGSGYHDIGTTYTAPYFSTCDITDCHPGLYLWPQRDMCNNADRIIMVIAWAGDVHKTPTKWRCKRFTKVS